MRDKFGTGIIAFLWTTTIISIVGVNELYNYSSFLNENLKKEKAKVNLLESDNKKLLIEKTYLLHHYNQLRKLTYKNSYGNKAD